MFFVIRRRQNFGHQILGESFHFGEYVDESDSKLIDEIGDNDAVAISKNVFSMPRILGQINMMVPTDLMLDMREEVVAKWRKVEFAPVFNFPWENDGNDPVEDYIAEIERAIDASDEYIELDPTPEDTTYQRLVEQCKIDDWKPETHYWEMFLENSTRCANKHSHADAVEFDWLDGPNFRIASDSKDSNQSLFSYSDLCANKILSIDSRTTVMLPEQYAKFSQFLESEFWECAEVSKADYPLTVHA
jgi:hypothetical protein